MTKEEKKELENLVYNYKTKYNEGFIKKEMNKLLKQFPNINKKRFNSAMSGNTCMIHDNDIIMYHCDVYHALLCGIENRNLKITEWD